MSRRLIVALALITVFAFGLRAWGLSAQVPTGDDLGVAYSAPNWVFHGQAEPSQPFHPRLRDFLVQASVALLGRGAWGLKGWSVLLGTLSIPLLGYFVWRLSRNESAAMLAAGLLALDGVHIDYSRQAIQEVHAALFLLLGTVLVTEAIVRGPSRSWRWLLPLAGVAFGLGTASKFYSIPALALSILILGWESARRRSWNDVLFVVTSLGVLSFTTFFLTYIPWFSRGYGVGDWLVYQRGLLEAMVTHTRDYAFLLYDEPAMWFVQPFTGFADFVVDPAGVGHLSIATGNPLVWLAVVPAVVYALVYKRERQAYRLLLGFFAVTYLPMALSARPVWVLSANAVLPFAIALVALVVTDLTKRFDGRIVVAYGVSTALISLALYPLAVGDALEHDYLRPIVGSMGNYGEQAQQGGGTP